MKNRNSGFYQKNIIYGSALNSDIKIENMSVMEQILLKIFKCKTVFYGVLYLKRAQSKRSLIHDIVHDNWPRKAN